MNCGGGARFVAALGGKQTTLLTWEKFVQHQYTDMLSMRGP